MSNKPFLLIDTSFFGYRSLYTTGDLSHEGIETGVVFGIFRAIMDLVELFDTNRICWTFDRGVDVRLEIDDRYKATRHNKDEDEETKEARRKIRNQLYRLRTKYLPELGFQNVFSQEGYESDDIIASICQDLPRGETAIIVSPDNDLLQCLVQDKITIWSPVSEKMITADSFSKQWGISPSQWTDVKAISGCPGDNVIGITGVGPKGAAQFLNASLKQTTKKYQAIIDGNEIWKHNLPLVSLPFRGTNHFELKEDDLLDEKWKKVMSDLGIKSLEDRSIRRRAR